MKFILKSKINLKTLLCLISVVLLINISIETTSTKFKTRKEKQNLEFNPEYKTFPNQFNAPTMEEQLEDAKFTAPLLSRALFEENPQQKLKLQDYQEQVRFTMYNMTRGESEQVFYFIDKNRDELVDQTEYDDFAMIYIYPFEACDKNHDYLLSEEEFKVCFKKDPVSRFITFRREKMEDYYKQIMDSITTRARNIINFADYILFKRATFGWKECQSTSAYMAKDAFMCAMRTALPIKYHLNHDLERFYLSGMHMVSDSHLIEMDFIAYLRTFYYSYVYIIFSNHQNIPTLGKSDFLKAIRDDRIPQNFSEEDVQILYDLMNNSPTIPNNNMNPESWFFWFNCHRLFNKYSITRPMQITEEELLKLMEDKFFPEKIAHSVDNSLTNFSTAEYSEASLILNKYRTNERDFFYKFKEVESSTSGGKLKMRNRIRSKKQDASALTHSYWETSKNYWPDRKNDTNRKVFYSIPTNNGKYSWTRKNYFTLMQLAEFFTTLTTDSTFLVPITTFHEKIYSQYDIFNPPINMMQRTNYIVYKTMPRDLRVDLLTFLCLELWTTKFADIKLYSNKYIDEADLKIILVDYGMKNMPDPVIDISKKGYDRLRRRIYDPKSTIINLFKVQATAAELVRNYNKMKTYKLKSTNEWSRKFFNWPRRFTASPYA